MRGAEARYGAGAAANYPRPNPSPGCFAATLSRWERGRAAALPPSCSGAPLTSPAKGEDRGRHIPLPPLDGEGVRRGRQGAADGWGEELRSPPPSTLRAGTSPVKGEDRGRYIPLSPPLRRR